ncbi:MAG: transposase [Rickettsiaceae bacterium]|nr:transposase [Rickettsiaceae bacterium]
MGFISNKIINGKKYAYEITSTWNKETKKVKKTSKYLGIVDLDGSIVKRKDRKIKQEQLLIDFGDGFLLNEFIKKSSIYSIMNSKKFASLPELIPLIIYRIITCSAMYNAEIWSEGNVTGLLHKNANLSSQNISKVLRKLSSERLQRDFFKEYLAEFCSISEDSKTEGVIIDATSLPNEINSSFNAWGRSDNTIEKQFRFMCIVDQFTKKPLFYRFLPGNLVDVSTLQSTILELKEMGVSSSFVLLDAGYCSEANILELYNKKIDFLTRLPADRKLYKQLLRKHIGKIETASNAIRYNNRTIFILKAEADLYGQKGYAYIALDLTRKSKEVDKALTLRSEDETEAELQDKFDRAGVMMLISSKDIAQKDVIETYYTRQTIEQIFGFFKSDLESLPIRRHNDDTIRGFLFLQFLALIIYIEFRKCLSCKFTAEQALMIMRNLKGKIFDNNILTAELTKKQREISSLTNILVPKFCGI